MIYGDITNCSVVGHGEITAYECRFGYQVISANTETNTREVLLQLEARTVNSRYATTGWQLTPVIDGEEVAPIGMNFTKANVNNWQVLGSRIITIVGAFNGIKTGSFTTNIPDEWGLKSGSASVNIVLADLHMPPAITTIITSEKNALLNGSPQIVQYLSMKEIEFEVTTYDDAAISSYQIHHNGVLIGSNTQNKLTLDFDNVGTLATFEMEGKTWCTLKFVVIDSFGTVGSSEMPFEVTKYTKPNLVKTSSSVKRNGQLTGKVKLNLIGAFFNQSVNGIANTISLKFTYWKKGEQEPTTYYDIPYETTDNNIDLYEWCVAKNNTEITDVSKDYAYNFKIKATDHFNKTSEITLLCPVGEYLWAEFKDRVDFKKITIQGVDRFEYSEEERVIGTWIDGKPLYRKVINFGALPNNTTKTIAHNISNVDMVIGISGVAFVNGLFYPLPLQYRGVDSTYNVEINVSKAAVIMSSNTDRSNLSAYVVLEYIKTTD